MYIHISLHATNLHDGCTLFPPPAPRIRRNKILVARSRDVFRPTLAALSRGGRQFTAVTRPRVISRWRKNPALSRETQKRPATKLNGERGREGGTRNFSLPAVGVVYRQIESGGRSNGGIPTSQGGAKGSRKFARSSSPSLLVLADSDAGQNFKAR